MRIPQLVLSIALAKACINWHGFGKLRALGSKAPATMSESSRYFVAVFEKKVQHILETAGHSETPPLPLEPSKTSIFKREVAELTKMVAVFLVLFWVLKSFVIEGYEVQGPSMLPSLADRERILVFKLPHLLSQVGPFRGLNAIDLGDIVVFESNVEGNKRYIKRVIAQGAPYRGSNTAVASDFEAAETPVAIEYENGAVYINGHRLLEEGYTPDQEEYGRDGYDTVYLKSGEYYVLGDHRSVSRDSRSFGPILHERIIGKAVLRFWPLNRAGLL